MKRSFFVLPVLAFAIAAPVSAQETPAGDAPDIQAILNMASQMMGGGTNRASLVDFRDLKALLPAEVAGLKRTSVNAERTGAVGMSISLAEAEYRDDADGNVFISIKDMSGTGMLGGMMQFGFGGMEIDRETETGFERTTELGGFPAKEKYDTELKEGDVQVFVDKRFHVEVTGRGVPLETLQAAVASLDLAKLAALKPKPKADAAAGQAPAAPAPAP